MRFQWKTILAKVAREFFGIATQLEEELVRDRPTNLEDVC